MATRVWTLTDTEQGVYVDHLAITAGDIEGPASGYSIKKRRLRGGPSDAVDVIEVDNGSFRFTVIPTRGMGVHRASLGEVELGWKAPAKGPVHPALVPLKEASGLGWLDGFDELLVRCGLESNGSPEFHQNGTLRYGLHGKIANLPAHLVKVSVDGDSGEISVTGVVHETRLFFNKLQLTTTYTTRPGQPGFTVTDTVTNLWSEPSELELLYHVNFGVPLLNPGSKLVLPVEKMTPRDSEAVEDLAEWDTYGPKSPGTPATVFFFELAAEEDGQTRVLLKNSEGDRGVSLKFNKSQLPCFTLWKHCQTDSDGYVTGLEPGVNFPNTKSFEKENGRVVTLQPGESRSFEITLEAHSSAECVAAAQQAVATIQGETTPEITEQPDPRWSQG